MSRGNDLEKLLSAVNKMRVAQKDYYRHKGSPRSDPTKQRLLRAATSAESEVDKLRKVLNEPQARMTY